MRSEAIISEVVNQAIELPGSHIAVVARSHELSDRWRDAVMARLKEKDYWKYETRNQGRVINFDNGSRIVFVHTKLLREGKYRGYKLFDEADYQR